MGVKVDQPGYDKKPAGIDDFRPSAGKIGADRLHLAVGKSDIGRLVACSGRVDDAATPDDQIRHVRPHFGGGIKTR